MLWAGLGRLRGHLGTCLGHVWDVFGRCFGGQNRGDSQGKDFGGCSGLFEGYFWRSFPYTNPRKNVDKLEKNQEKHDKN